MRVGSDDRLQVLLELALTSERDFSARLEALHGVAQVYAAEGERGGCDRALIEAVRILSATRRERVIRPIPLSEEAMKFGFLAARLERPRLARAAYTLGLRCMEDMGRSSSLPAAWFAIGNTWSAEGDAARALECFREADHLRQPGEESVAEMALLCALAEAEVGTGSVDAAERALNDAVEVLQTLAHRATASAQDVLSEATRLGRLAGSLGRFGIARRAYWVAAEQMSFLNDHPGLGSIWHLVGGTYAAEKDAEHALVAYRRAAQFKQFSSNAQSRIATLLALAEVEQRWGREPGAERALGEVVVVLRGAVSEPAEPQALVKLVVNVGERVFAMGYLEIARQVYALGRPLVGIDFEAMGDQEQ